LDFVQTHRLIDDGLEREPRNLDLLSLRAAAHFLSDETEAFQRDVAAVLGQNPDYARLFRLVAEYAEAEHRYKDTIPLLRRALALDPMDSQVHAHLAIQLLRSGEEPEGRRELIRAFAQDPFDLRIRNTLVLYERKLDQDYTLVRRPPFILRLPKAYEKPLTEIVPPWLEAAVWEMNGRYGKLDTNELMVELYADRDSFGVRTSGVPSSDLQGVCFGHTIAARLPLDEPVNLGMTLWHELSHVYHLQLSNHRVPRWFTEGLAEVETKRRRPEWAREQELLVYEAYEDGRLPKITQMNQGFSHAASLDDLAVAYLTSTYLVEHLVRTYGWKTMPRLLRAWGNHEPTERVLTGVLGASLEVLEARFARDLEHGFAKFRTQYIPPPRPRTPITREDESKAGSRTPRDLAQLAHAELLAGHFEQARAWLDRVTVAEQKHPDVLWIRGLLRLLEGHPEHARTALKELLDAGHDGYFVRMQLALLAERLGDSRAETKALLRAREWHRTATEPLSRLAAKARSENDTTNELSYVSELCKLEESDATLHRRHVELRLSLRQRREAWLAAETLLFVDPLGRESHELAARAALATGDRRRALRELDLAAELSGSSTVHDRLERLSAAIRAGAMILPSEPRSADTSD
jgi:tetratricopeptide (TPR) repeat protein